MTDVAKAYDKTEDNYILFGSLQDSSKLRRFTIDKYLAEAAAKGLLRVNGIMVFITEAGRSYLNEQGIVDA